MSVGPSGRHNLGEHRSRRRLSDNRWYRGALSSQVHGWSFHNCEHFAYGPEQSGCKQRGVSPTSARPEKPHGQTGHATCGRRGPWACLLAERGAATPTRLVPQSQAARAAASTSAFPVGGRSEQGCAPSASVPRGTPLLRNLSVPCFFGLNINAFIIAKCRVT